MDITPNKYDALILRLANLSPNVRHVLDGEVYRLRLETDDVESEHVLQECVMALRDDLAAIGLYFTCQLSEVYDNYLTFAEFLDVCEYLFPNTLYPKIRSDYQILPQIKAMLTGSVEDGDLIHTYLRWLGVDPDCYVPSCTDGATWLLSRISSTELFSVYLSNLIQAESTLGHPIFLSPEDLLSYTATIRDHATALYHALTLVQDLPEMRDCLSKVRRRVDLHIRYLLQPAHAAENAWMWHTDPATLSEGVRSLYEDRRAAFAQSSKLYGAYYISKTPIQFTDVDVAGIALRISADGTATTHAAYLSLVIEECKSAATLTIGQRHLVLRLASCLYPA